MLVDVSTGGGCIVESRCRIVAVILLCALLVGACPALWGCDRQPAVESETGPSAPAGGLTDQAAAEIVLRYFATTAADHMQGVVIEGLQITTQMGQRTLRLDTVSDGSEEADKSLAWLCLGATSEKSWTGDLDREWGLGLVWVHIYTTYPWGYSEHSVVDIAGRSLVTYGGAAHWRGGPDTTTLVSASPVSPPVEGTAEETLTTASVPPSTTNTLAPGQITFGTVVDRFERLVGHEDLAGTLPYSVLPREELTWLFDAAMPFAVTDARGYRFANGDLVVLFFLAPPPGGLDGALAAAGQFAELMCARFGDRDAGVWPHSGDRYGYVVVSKEHREDLGRLAHWAVSAHQLLIP